MSVSSSSRSFGVKWLSVLASAAAVILVLGLASEIEARGRGGGGGMRKGGRGGMHQGGFSRSGPARGGSIRHDRSGGGYRSHDRAGGGGWDRSGVTPRGGGFGDRRGNRNEREKTTRTNSGSDVEWKGKVKKTEDGFIARGVVVGEDGAAAGTIVRKGDQTRIRGVATDGKNVSVGRVNCNGSRCVGGRVNVKVNNYYRSPYYYHPYYYGWYSCPYGTVQTWHSHYGTPIYGCSNVVVVHTTISLGSGESTTTTTTTTRSGTTTTTTTRSGTSSHYLAESGAAGGYVWPREAGVSSAPVLMYEVSPEIVAYATTYEPADTYSEKHGDRYYWVPGPEKESANAKEWLAAAAGMEQPTANATVITYTVGDRVVYLTNERPAPEFYAETTDQLFVWVPGVRTPTDEDRALIARVIEAQKEGGKQALDREVRKLEKGREAPPNEEGTES